MFSDRRTVGIACSHKRIKSYLQYVYVIWFSFEISPIRACFAAMSTNSEVKNAKISQTKISNVFKSWESFSNSMLNMSAKLQWIIPSRSWEKLKRHKKNNNTPNTNQG